MHRSGFKVLDLGFGFWVWVLGFMTSGLVKISGKENGN